MCPCLPKPMNDRQTARANRRRVPRKNTSKSLFERFRESPDNLWVCRDNEPFFKAGEVGLAPLLNYLAKYVDPPHKVTVCDRIVDRAAALLLKKARCDTVFAVLGSKLAAHALDALGIAYSFDSTIPHIVNKAGNDMCPMEKLSLGKTPEEFHRLLRE